MKATIVIVHSVFNGQREVFSIDKKRQIRSLAPVTDLPFIAVLNGEVLLRKSWRRKLKDGDVLAFIVRPGGGGGGSNPLQMVAVIALSMVAPGIGTAIATEFGSLTGLAYEFAVAASTMAINLVGGQVINAMFGNSGSQPSSLKMQDSVAASPTYSLSAQGNRARLGSAIPEIFGRHLVYPDVAAAPYTEYIGHEQYLYQLFCIGRGHYDLEGLRIGDSPISSFGEVEYEIIPPSGAVKLFSSNVVTASEVSGQEMQSWADCSLTASNISFDAASKKLTAGSGTPFTNVRVGRWVSISNAANFGNNGSFKVTAYTATTLTLSTTTMVDEAIGASITIEGFVVGPFVLTNAGVETSRISADVIAPKGLFYANDDGGLNGVAASFRLEMRKINTATGAVEGTWFSGAPEHSVYATLKADETTYIDGVAAIEASNNGSATFNGATGSVPGIVSSTLSKVQKVTNTITEQFTGTGAKTTFTLANKTVSVATIKVQVDGKTLTSGWSFSDNTGAGGKDEIVFTTPPRLPPTVRVQAAGGIPGVNATASYVNQVQPNILITYKKTTSDVNENVSGATQTPRRWTVSYDVPLGRYQVRMIRPNLKNYSTRCGNDLVWAGARAYIDDTTNYGDVTLLAVKMRATNNLSSKTSQQINCVVTRKLPIWNGAAWSAPTATRSIAWALAYICKTRNTDSKFDLAWLLAQDAIWTARGDTFNGIFDSAITFGEALTMTARAGRAKWYQHGMVIRFFRDAAATVPTAVFNSRNTVKGSFTTDYILQTEETADSVTIEYFDEELWSQSTVDCILDTSAKPATIKLFGVTTRAQAWREGMYEASANRYRRVLPKLTTEMEGFIPLPGDLVALQRNLNGWGKAGDVVNYVAGTKTLTLSEAVTFVAGTHYIAFKKRDGSFDGPYTVTAGIDGYNVVSATALSFSPDTLGTDRERTSYVFGPAANFYQKARVIGLRPRSMSQVELTFVVESDAVHTADTGAVPAAPANWNLQSTVQRPPVNGLTVTLGGNAVTPQLVVEWLPSPNADHYVAQISYDNAMTWQRMDDTFATSINVPYRDGGVAIRVAAVGMAQGDWTVWSNTPDTMPPADVLGFGAQYVGGVVSMQWLQVNDASLQGYEIRYNPLGNTSWDSGSVLTAVTRGTRVTTAAIPPGTWTLLIKAKTAAGRYSDNAATVSLVVANALTVVKSFNAVTYSAACTLTNAVQHWTGSFIPKSKTLMNACADWKGWDASVFDPFETATIELPELDVDFDSQLRSWAALTSDLMPGAVGISTPQLQFDYHTETGIYDGYQNWDVGFALYRYGKFKVTLDSTKGLTYLSRFEAFIDGSDLSEDLSNLAINAGGSNVIFANRYHFTPHIQVTSVGLTAASTSVANITGQNADVFLFNTAGASISGNANIKVSGL